MQVGLQFMMNVAEIDSNAFKVSYAFLVLSEASRVSLVSVAASSDLLYYRIRRSSVF
jgi:hypothetical protein